jgi:hypothetical protein
MYVTSKEISPYHAFLAIDFLPRHSKWKQEEHVGFSMESLSLNNDPLQQ